MEELIVTSAIPAYQLVSFTYVNLLTSYEMENWNEPRFIKFRAVTGTITVPGLVFTVPIVSSGDGGGAAAWVTVTCRGLPIAPGAVIVIVPTLEVFEVFSI